MPTLNMHAEYGASIGLLNQSHAHVLALAPHTVAATRAILGKHGLNISVDLFVPIFAIDTSCLEDEPGCVDADTRKGFVLQGLFANNRSAFRANSRANWLLTLSATVAMNCPLYACRRDYQGLFDSIRGNTQLMADPAFQLSLIGKGELALPAGLASKVTKHDSLPYKDYYRLIQGSRGLLTAFASDVYNTVKASSSVTTALVCATPLVMTKEALAAYNFLTEVRCCFVLRCGPFCPDCPQKHGFDGLQDAVIISDGNDADAMQRALSLPDGAVEAKLSAVEAIRAKLSLRNQLLLMRKLMHGRSLCAAGQ